MRKKGGRKGLLRFMPIAAIMMAFLSACQSEQIDIPQKSGSYYIVSHVKEPTLAFINKENLEVEKITALSTIWEQLIAINDTEFVFLSNESRMLSTFSLETGKVSPIVELDEPLSDVMYDAKTDSLMIAYATINKVEWRTLQGERLEDMQLACPATELEIEGSTLFALCAEDNVIVTVDRESLDMKESFSVLDRASGMYVEDNNLWIGGHGPTGQLNHQIDRYDVQTGEKVGTVDIGLMPIAIDGDGQNGIIYAIAHGNDHLYKINGGSDEVVATSDVGHNPNYIQVDEEVIVVSNFDSHSLTFLSSETLEKQSDIEVGAGPYAVVSGEVK